MELLYGLRQGIGQDRCVQHADLIEAVPAQERLKREGTLDEDVAAVSGNQRATRSSFVRRVNRCRVKRLG